MCTHVINKGWKTASRASLGRRFKGAVINFCPPTAANLFLISSKNDTFVFNIKRKVGITINRVYGIKSFILVLGILGTVALFLLVIVPKNPVDIV